MSPIAQMLFHDSVKIHRMANARAKLTRETLRLLTREMAEPRVAASALKVMRHGASQEQRQLIFIDSFQGYKCSCCGSRFPESTVRGNFSLFEKRHLAKVLREKQFLKHDCW
jgi:hypothetical protein